MIKTVDMRSRSTRRTKEAAAGRAPSHEKNSRVQKSTPKTMTKGGRNTKVAAAILKDIENEENANKSFERCAFPSKKSSKHGIQTDDDGNLNTFLERDGLNDTCSTSTLDSADMSDEGTSSESTLDNESTEDLNDEGPSSSSNHSSESDETYPRLSSYDSSMTQVEIQEATLKNDAMAQMVATTLRNHHVLKTVRIIYNSKSIVRIEILKTLLTALGANPTISDLEINGASIDRDFAGVLGDSLMQNKFIKKLTISKCRHVGSGLAVLFIGLQHNKSIQELTFMSSCLGGYASDVVAATLPVLAIKRLVLENASLTRDGLAFLLQKIQHAKSQLTELNLSNNDLGLDGISLIMRCIQSPTCKLEKLVLCGCNLDVACVQALHDDFPDKDCRLQKIHLNRNPRIGNKGAAYLVQLLKKHNSIKELEVDSCQLSSFVQKSLDDGLRYNNTFLSKLFSTEVSLAILDSVNMMEQEFKRR